MGGWVGRRIFHLGGPNTFLKSDGVVLCLISYSVNLSHVVCLCTCRCVLGYRKIPTMLFKKCTHFCKYFWWQLGQVVLRLLEFNCQTFFLSMNTLHVLYTRSTYRRCKNGNLPPKKLRATEMANVLVSACVSALQVTNYNCN